MDVDTKCRGNTRLAEHPSEKSTIISGIHQDVLDLSQDTQAINLYGWAGDRWDTWERTCRYGEKDR